MSRTALVLVSLLPVWACDDSVTSPEPEASRPEFVSVATGNSTACALTTDGDVYCWGSHYGPQPQLIPGGHRFESLSIGEAGEYDVFGGFHACGVTTAGAGRCWGDNYWGQLGNGEYHVHWVSEPVPVQGDLRFTRLAAGDDNTCGLVDDGSVYCWGQNGDGHLGTPPDVYTTTPARLPTDLRFSDLVSGRWFKCAITWEGEVYCWGDDYAGQLGDGFYEDRVNPQPRPVLGVSTLRSLAAGYEHACGVSADGLVTYCWGQNNARQLDDGTTTDSDSAVVAGRSTPSFSQVDAGSYGTCGLASNGDVYCWGSTCPFSDQPRRIEGLPPLVSVSVGQIYGCGMSQDGWVHCWGDNSLGQLGRGYESGSAETFRCKAAAPIAWPE